MKGIQINNRGIAIFAGLVLMIGIVAGSAMTGNAQNNRYGRNWDGYPNWGGSYELRQTALNAGYNEGNKQGTNDRARGRQSNFQDFSSYRNGNKDYNSRMGDRELYRRYFQLAFENGYADGMGTSAGNYPGNAYPGNNYPGDDRGRHRSRYGRNWDGYPNWGGGYQLRQTALNAGYNEGHKLGQQDRSRNRYSDYSRSSSYRNATKDYSSRLGDRELYRRYFQEAFQNGYADGYEGY